MNDLHSFDFDNTPIRAMMVGQTPWFAANDLCAVLDIRNSRDAISKLDEDEKGVHVFDTPGGSQTLNMVNESGMFSLVFKSRKPEAKRFRRWVTGEVLPALRRDGHYALPIANDDPIVEEFDSARLSASIATVREARRLFGPQSARVIWTRLGLPAPLALSAPNVPVDPMAREVETYLRTVEATTIDEAGLALGLGSIDAGMRLRIGALLRLFGWLPRKVRRGHQTVNLFAPCVVEA